LKSSDLLDLLRGGVSGSRWADLGAGEGAFTFALAELLVQGGQIVAVDRDAYALRGIGEEMSRRFPAVAVETVTADFTRPLGLSELDGVLMANSLHFVRDKAPVLSAIRGMLRPEGRLIIVEYGSDRGNPWVPHPFSYRSWERLAADAGFTSTRLLHTIPSRHLGSMYSALSM